MGGPVTRFYNQIKKIQRNGLLKTGTEEDYIELKGEGKEKNAHLSLRRSAKMVEANTKEANRV
jgi:hypothetical protein